ncbi:hypothetical protein DEJ36_00480 [Curtobacterium sp. MCPF17_052]|nr:hypothetical protein [Curtobacterium sp. MCPF17_052]WIB12660.1 hypothetical protein DEJ36_00480 [Curtobacterium sp. MCPF17_052]
MRDAADHASGADHGEGRGEGDERVRHRVADEGRDEDRLPGGASR